jgi:hypothetical protein
LRYVDDLNDCWSAIDASDSPSNKTQAPNNTMSFSKNCPGTTAKAGNPPKLGSQPGVENRKLRVVKNINIASTLPMADTLADSGLSAIITAMTISTTPSKLEKACTLKI